MGHGSFRDEDYHSSRVARSNAGKADFEYTETATKVHPSLDPKRIPAKPFGMLESRDSVEHPISTPVILTFDVTGSNFRNAAIAQKNLPKLMAALSTACENPQIAIWANDDVKSACGVNSIQLGEFESDIRIDETIRNIWLTGNGGGNGGESYDLLLYAAARKTITDSMEKRNKKGYMFLYADEPFFDEVAAADVRIIFDDVSEADIPIADMIAEVRQKWEVYVIWPRNGYVNAREQYVTLFGDEFVEDLQSPELLCEKVASIVSRREQEMQNNAELAVVGDDYHSRQV